MDESGIYPDLTVLKFTEEKNIFGEPIPATVQLYAEPKC
jgi:hypothetical protein